MIVNRHGLVVDAELLQCNGTAERDAALLMVERLEGNERVTVAGDKGNDTRDFVKEMRGMNATPHVAQNEKRAGGSAIDGRTTRHEGYRITQQKRIEEVFGWLKTVGMLRKTRHRGLLKVGWSASRSRGSALQVLEESGSREPPERRCEWPTTKSTWFLSC